MDQATGTMENSIAWKHMLHPIGQIPTILRVFLPSATITSTGHSTLLFMLLLGGGGPWSKTSLFHDLPSWENVCWVERKL